MPSNRKFALYFPWDKLDEASRPLDELNNRFPALYEVRRVAWPMLQHLKGGDQGIAGFLDRVVLSDFTVFLQVVAEETGVEPTVIAGRELDGTVHSLREVLAGNPHTIVIVSIDHFRAQRLPSTEDIAVLRAFLACPEKMLIVCPHHCVGGEERDEVECYEGETLRRQVEEHRHHADSLVPGIQRLGGYARSLLNALELPVENLYGLRPAVGPDGQPASLEVARELDLERFLGGGRSLAVENFNAHPHLPHLQPVGRGVAAYRVLARQLISLEADPHPFVTEGNTHFNALLWAPPFGKRRGHVLVCDATIWSAAFMGVDSLMKFWRNLAARPVI
ncbi:hypothetical protein [Pseudomonas sp. LLC-1]|uniref:hypothetical protein n=1 Tax=Pseudomonas sp. LLC-1 TaxID=1812180 RepID=UPI0011B80B64|nr:hypothetical protein [Pseudomonas sp. LLC-1]